MDMMLWNIALSAIIALISWFAKSMWDELQRQNILLNRTREEIAKEYVTKAEVHADINRVMDRLDALDAKIDRLIESADAKEEIKKKAADGDMEAFMALEDIKNQEAEVKRTFIYQGRPGLWEDYQKFMQTRKELKENEIKRAKAKKARQKKLIKDWTIGIIATVGILSVVGLAVYILYWVITNKGR